MSDYYILDGHTPTQCASLREWGQFFEDTERRRVAATEIGDVRVSTVFLGLDHSFGEGPPLLFETMVFGGPLDEEMDRYSTWEEAVEGHAKMVERVRGAPQMPQSETPTGKDE